MKYNLNIGFVLGGRLMSFLNSAVSSFVHQILPEPSIGLSTTFSLSPSVQSNPGAVTADGPLVATRSPPGGAVVPDLPTDASGGIVGGGPAVTSALLENNRGMMFGDVHGDVSIPRYLAGQMPSLKQQGVEVLFIEMFQSKDQAVLDQFMQDGDKAKLAAYLEENNWNKGPGWIDAVVDMADSARRAGIKLVGLDIENTGGTRLETSNPHWASVVNQTMEGEPDSSKYVIYGGRGHSADYSMNRGVDTMLGIPSVDFNNPVIDSVDLAPGQIIRNPDANSSDFLFAPPT